jgi:hypothetical protein
MHLPLKNMNKSSKNTLKKIREYTHSAEIKFKKDKKLYKLLDKQMKNITEIILSKQNII